MAVLQRQAEADVESFKEPGGTAHSPGTSVTLTGWIASNHCFSTKAEYLSQGSLLRTGPRSAAPACLRSCRTPGPNTPSATAPRSGGGQTTPDKHAGRSPDTIPARSAARGCWRRIGSWGNVCASSVGSIRQVHLEALLRLTADVPKHTAEFIVGHGSQLQTVPR
jgi:hypothetical protein